ncbi:carboxylic ester hydrolase [Mycolicibacterium anyangense]|uniref:Carboxylic ester hydrolase n=1 Tax=Mycolicibacterium anyangense TaxID=1431246 RepID=A0A6N4W3L9_9MYCO|nr:carboxylesterase family protein [Mycolicibacterium anyangense]BBZ74973.1 carboxylic ester hydrolase [Mycolicibacterium anyangense]
MSPSKPVVESAAGTFVGVQHGLIAQFLGIPFAQPPIGELRFALPQAVAPLRGEFDATRFGPTPPASMELPEPFTYPSIEGDDWLTLNIWTPAPVAHDAQLPVYVWFYGGSFAMGNTAEDIFDGSTFARDGIVYVSANYRVGIEGFTHFPDAPDNRGLHDQILALQWVHDNIASFGGDPNQVTIGGESAGSMSVSTLATTRFAGKLFQRVICESGIGIALERADAAKATDFVAAALHKLPTAKSVGTLEAREAGRRVADKLRKLSPHNILTVFAPVIDGDLLQESPVASLSERQAPVTMIIGHNKREADFWRVFGEFAPPDGVLDALALALTPFRATRELTQAYVDAYGDTLSKQEIFVEFLSDAAFCAPSLAAQRGQATTCYAYLFTWPSSIHTRTAMHTLDLGFAFDNIHAPGFVAYAGPDAPQSLADEIHGSWVRFIKTGVPDDDWQPYRSEADLKIFGPAGQRNIDVLSAWKY